MKAQSTPISASCGFPVSTNSNLNSNVADSPAARTKFWYIEPSFLGAGVYNTNKVNIKAVPANPKATVTGDGEVVLTVFITFFKLIL